MHKHSQNWSGVQDPLIVNLCLLVFFSRHTPNFSLFLVYLNHIQITLVITGLDTELALTKNWVFPAISSLHRIFMLLQTNFEYLIPVQPQWNQLIFHLFCATTSTNGELLFDIVIGKKEFRKTSSVEVCEAVLGYYKGKARTEKSDEGGVKLLYDCTSVVTLRVPTFCIRLPGFPCLLQLYTRLHSSDYRSFWNTERWKSFDKYLCIKELF